MQINFEPESYITKHIVENNYKRRIVFFIHWV